MSNTEYRRWPALIVLTGQDQGLRLEMTGERHRIGAGTDMDMTISDPSIKPHHCDIVRLETGQYGLLDVQGTSILERGSLMEMFMSKWPFNSSSDIKDELKVLKDADIIRLGTVELFMEDPSEDEQNVLRQDMEILNK